MDEMERKEDPSLPPDYVSLAQLRERWSKKLQEKEEEERKEREARAQNENRNRRGLKSDARQKMAGLSLNNAPRRRVEKKSGREIGVIEDERKGKEIARPVCFFAQRIPSVFQAIALRESIGASTVQGFRRGGDSLHQIVGSENGEKEKKTKTKKKKKKKRDNRKKGKKNSAENGENKNGRENEKLVGDIKEIDGGDEREGVEIVNQNEVKLGIKSGENSGRGGNNGGLKGIEEIVSVNMVEVLPDVRKMDFRGGFRGNCGNWALRSNNTKKEYRVGVNDSEKKMENEKGYGKKWRERRRNDESCYRLKENRADVFKGNELEPESEKKAEDEISEVCNEIVGLNERDKNKNQDDRIEAGDLNDNGVEMEKKVDNGVLVVESVKNFRNGYRRNWNERGRHGRKFSGLSSNDWKTGNLRSNVGDGRRYGRTRRFEGRWDANERESGMMWVKKEEKLAAEVASSGISEDQA